MDWCLSQGSVLVLSYSFFIDSSKYTLVSKGSTRLEFENFVLSIF